MFRRLMMGPVRMGIEDVLDLHSFPAGEIPDLLETYLAACVEKEIYSVRVIHGKGRGMLRKWVQGLLEKNPLVVGMRVAPAEAGGWGATIVELRREG